MVTVKKDDEKVEAPTVKVDAEWRSLVSELLDDATPKVRVLAVLAEMGDNLEIARTALSTKSADLPEYKAFVVARTALETAQAGMPERAMVEHISSRIQNYITTATLGRDDCADLAPPAAKRGRPKGSKNTK